MKCVVGGCSGKYGDRRSFLIFLFARIKNCRKRSVCPQVPKFPKFINSN